VELERALAVLTDEIELAHTRFALARTLDERTRARELATAARETFRKQNVTKHVAKVDAWLAAH
jgi:hypothetical protein